MNYILISWVTMVEALCAMHVYASLLDKNLFMIIIQ